MQFEHRYPTCLNDFTQENFVALNDRIADCFVYENVCKNEVTFGSFQAYAILYRNMECMKIRLFDVLELFYTQNGQIRVPTSSGNHGKPGKSQKEVPCMEKSRNLKKTLNNHGKIMEFYEII